MSLNPLFLFYLTLKEWGQNMKNNQLLEEFFKELAHTNNVTSLWSYEFGALVTILKNIIDIMMIASKATDLGLME